MKKRVKHKLTRKSSSKTPGLVKALAIIGYIITAFLLITGIMSFIAISNVQDHPLKPQIDAATAQIGVSINTLFISFGIILIALAVLGFFISRGLLKRQQWARILTIVITILWGLSFLLNTIQGAMYAVIPSAINIAIAAYLIFNKRVKAAFK